MCSFAIAVHRNVNLSISIYFVWMEQKKRPEMWRQSSFVYLQKKNCFSRHDFKTHAKWENHWSNGVIQCIFQKYTADGNWSNKLLWIIEMIHSAQTNKIGNILQMISHGLQYVTKISSKLLSTHARTDDANSFDFQFVWENECVSLFSRFIYHDFLTLCERWALASLKSDACTLLWKDCMIHVMYILINYGRSAPFSANTCLCIELKFFANASWLSVDLLLPLI